MAWNVFQKMKGKRSSDSRTVPATPGPRDYTRSEIASLRRQLSVSNAKALAAVRGRGITLHPKIAEMKGD